MVFGLAEIVLMVDNKDYTEQMVFMLGIYGLWCGELITTVI
jgi:hypothetical protein